jgi:hypothetical protein
LDSEGNPSTWFATVLLLVTGASALLCGLLDRTEHQVFWYLVGGLFLAMSFEEVSQVHELVSGNLRSAVNDEGPVTAMWVLPAAAGLVMVAIVVRAVAPRLAPALRTGLLAGTFLLLIGSLGFELGNSDNPLFKGEVRDPRRVLVIATVEENLELLGAMILAHMMTSHLVHLGGGGASVRPTR